MKLFFKTSVASGLAATSALALLMVAMPALADEGDAPDGGGGDPGVARLSILNGDVDVKRADSGDTVAAAINAPVSDGDYVTTHGDSRAEIQYGFGSAVRVAPDTQLRFTHLDPNNHALQLAEGTVEMRVFRGLEAHPEVDTPSATIRPDERGQFRVTVTNDGNTLVTVRSGRADVVTQGGTQTISPDSTLLVEGQGDDVRFRTIETVAMDGFDQWNTERDSAFDRVRDYAYVDQGIVGADDLGQYGHWVDNPTYGEVWSPDEGADWAPYHDGRWVWEPYYGWTWVGDEAWGYAPYHYGSWFYANNNWFWYPGAYVGARVYRPALVAFFSFGGGGGGFGVGFGNIGWIALAPFEPFRPWWGRGGFGGRETIVNNITIRNVTINNYRNLRVNNSAAAINNASFANGDFRHITTVRDTDYKTITAVRGVVPVVPTNHNLAYNPRANAPTNAPVSQRFGAFKNNVPQANRPSFEAQRATVVTAAQRDYPEHAAAIVHPATETAPERGTTPPERSVISPERASGNESTLPKSGENTTDRPGASGNAGHDPWSRFGDNGGSNAGTRTTTTPRETTPRETTSGATSGTMRGSENATRPATSSGGSNGGAWSRFNNTGSNGSPGRTGPTTTTRSSGNSYGSSNSYGNGNGNATGNSGSRYGNYGNTHSSSTGGYPSGGNAPSYHQSTPTSHYAAPTSHQQQPPASHPSAPNGGGSGGGGSHAHASSGGSGNGTKPSSKDSKHDH